MNIWMFYIGRRERLEVVTEGSTRNIGESRRQANALNSVVAFGAQVNLPVARKFGWIQNASLSRIFGLGFMEFFQSNVIRAGAMAALTGDARDQALPVVSIRARVRGKSTYICRVAFQACRIYGARKIGSPINVAWTVDPSMTVAPITDRQFE